MLKYGQNRYVTKGAEYYEQTNRQHKSVRQKESRPTRLQVHTLMCEPTIKKFATRDAQSHNGRIIQMTVTALLTRL